MLEFLRGWIINIVTISIILILFEIIIPSGKIKKIITLVSGFVLLIAVINPFIALKNKSYDLSEGILSDSLYIDKKEVETGSRLLEETQSKQIVSVYKRKLTSRIEEEAGKLKGVTQAKATVEIVEDTKSDNFGEITKISVEIKKDTKKNNRTIIEPVATVEKIEISTPANRKKENESLRFVDPEDKRLTELVKQSLNKTLEVSKDSIEVKIT